MIYNDTYPVIRDVFAARVERDGVLPFLRKSTDWAYEREWRVVLPERVNQALLFAPEALAAVLLGLRISPEDRAYLLGLVAERERRFGRRPPIYVAEPASQQYRVRFRRI